MKKLAVIVVSMFALNAFAGQFATHGTNDHEKKEHKDEKKDEKKDDKKHEKKDEHHH